MTADHKERNEEVPPRFARPFKTGDLVNVLSNKRGKYLKKNVCVVFDEYELGGATYVEVALNSGVSAGEAFMSGLYTDFHYTRLELVKAADKKGATNA